MIYFTIFCELEKNLKQLGLFLLKPKLWTLYFGLGVIWSCGPSKAWEKEPNDEPYSSQKFSLPVKIMGSFNSTRPDKDYFRFNISQEAFIDFDLLLSGGLYEDFNFLGPNGLAIKTYERSLVKDGELKGRLHFMPGPYTVFLRGNYRREVTYQLSLLEARIKDFEKEPNDEALTATPLYPNQKITGSFFPRDEDWYLLDDPNCEKDDVTYHFDLSEVPNVDSQIELFALDGSFLHRIDQGRVGESESLKRFALPYRHRLYLKVSSRGGAPNSKNYTFFAERQKRDPRWEVEANATLEAATYWEKNQEEIQGLIAWREDVDFYSFSNESSEGKMLNLVCAPTFNFKLQTTLLDQEGETLTEFITSNQIVFNMFQMYLLPGKYFAKVLSPSDKYDPTKRYTFKKFFKDVTWGQEMEPNDQWVSSTPFKVGDLEKGELNQPNDIDSFLVNIPQKGKYQFEVNPNHQARAFDLICQKQDHSSLELKEDATTHIWTGQVTLDEERIFLQLSASNQTQDLPYFIKVTKI